MASQANFLSSFDDTLPTLPTFGETATSGGFVSLQLPSASNSTLPLSNVGSQASGTAEAALTGLYGAGELVDVTDPNAIASQAGSTVGSAITGAEQAATTTFFGSRFVAIVLGLLLIGGAILLFLSDDIADAINKVAKVASD